MLKFIKQIAGPTIFSKGLAQYSQRNYHIARPLFIKAAQWMPTLESEVLFQSVTCLCDYHLNADPVNSAHHYENLYNALLQSPHIDTPDYTAVAAEIKEIMATLK